MVYWYCFPAKLLILLRRCVILCQEYLGGCSGYWRRQCMIIGIWSCRPPGRSWQRYLESSSQRWMRWSAAALKLNMWARERTGCGRRNSSWNRTGGHGTSRKCDYSCAIPVGNSLIYSHKTESSPEICLCALHCYHSSWQYHWIKHLKN